MLRLRKPLLIFQMGKVGSTSVHEALLECNYKNYHVHNLIQPKMLREETVTNLMKKNFKPDIITLTREIIGRNISAFFQNCDLPDQKGQWFIGNKPKILNMSSEQLFNAFLNCPQWKHDEAASWFDTQLKPLFNIDVYQTPFDTNKGWQIYHHNDIRCLLIRMENLDNLEAINDFLEVKLPKKISNRAEDHWYKDIYKNFTKQIGFFDNYIENMYDSKYMKHFYSEEEMISFRKKWHSNTQLNRELIEIYANLTKIHTRLELF